MYIISCKKCYTFINSFKYITSKMIFSPGNLPWNRPLAILYPLPPIKIILYRAAISSFPLDRRSQWSPGRYAHAYGICAPFYCISLKKVYGVLNAASGLISMDINNHKYTMGRAQVKMAC